LDLTLLSHVLLSVTLWASPAGPAVNPSWHALTRAEVAELRALDERLGDELAEQRGGALEETAPLDPAERDALMDAQSSAAELQEQRGGDLHLTDRELKIILFTAAAVAVLALVLL
jgi:hypothetical protein